MQASKAGVSLRNIALTPERIPTFIIPSRLRYPRAQLDSETDQSRLMSPISPNQHLSTSTPSSRLPRLPSTPTMRAKLHRNLSPGEDLSDPSTRAAMSLPHVDKVTTSYGFRALAQSPCTRRRESLFHKGATATGLSFETNMDCLSRTTCPSSSVDLGDQRRTTSTNSNLADVPPSTAAPSESEQKEKTGRVAGLQTQLGMSQQKVQQRVQRREKELKELQQAVESLKRSAQEAAEDNERIFTELIRSLEKLHTEAEGADKSPGESSSESC
uniref:TRIM8/14/16/25/29/45/65 coiled-coil region domain-containing protein n=1 Tax=Oncorhynchus mykiss TaxID=8022 RepID=A0A8K9XJ70_ONCMY